MAKLYYQGHGSFRLTSANGTVLYVDPYVGDGYQLPADYILVTHEHGDHNQISLVTKKPECRIIRARDCIKNGNYATFSLNDGLTVQAVPAYNQNHRREECVGYVITIDNVTVYAAGDTSTIPEMASILAPMHLDYAILPTDGHYNMGPEEAASCAQVIGAKHTIPIHTKPGELFDESVAMRMEHPSRCIVHPGQEIDLSV